MDTDSFIAQLANDSKPTRPLSNPWTRTGVWLAISVPYVIAVVMFMSLRGDILDKVVSSRFLIEQLAALLTGITAAVAAFASTIPGYNRKYLLLPLLPLVIWLGTLGVGCVVDFSHHGVSGPDFHADWFCIPGIIIVGAVPGISIALMLKQGAPLTPALSTALAGLAAAGIGDFGLRLFHPEDAGLIVLIWQFGTVVILSMAAAWAGKYILTWRAKIAAENLNLS